MFTTAVVYLESKTPTWLKVIIALVVVGWMTPLKVREWTLNLIDTRVHAVIAPFKVSQGYEIKAINDRIDTLNDKANETNAFVRAIALEQLGPKRYQEVELTKTK